MEGQTVVVTGASAGIGRATARLYGLRGARVGLIAPGRAGLDGAAGDVADANAGTSGQPCWGASCWRSPSA